MQQSYERPDNLDEALTLLDQSPRQVLAGGTDVYAALGDHSSLGHVLDVTAIPDLTGIKDAGDHWRIGASSTWSDVLAANLPKSFDCLKLAAFVQCIACGRWCAALNGIECQCRAIVG